MNQQAADLALFKHIFNDLGSVTPEMLRAFLDATTNQLVELKDQLESQDPEMREEGAKNAQGIRKTLETLLEHIAQLAHTTPEQLVEQLSNKE